MSPIAGGTRGFIIKQAASELGHKLCPPWGLQTAVIAFAMAFEPERPPGSSTPWFNPTLRWGFMKPDGGGADVFVHVAAVERAGLKVLKVGQRVECEETARPVRSRSGSRYRRRPPGTNRRLSPFAAGIHGLTFRL